MFYDYVSENDALVNSGPNIFEEVWRWRKDSPSMPWWWMWGRVASLCEGPSLPWLARLLCSQPVSHLTFSIICVPTLSEVKHFDLHVLQLVKRGHFLSCHAMQTWPANSLCFQLAFQLTVAFCIKWVTLWTPVRSTWFARVSSTCAHVLSSISIASIPSRGLSRPRDLGMYSSLQKRRGWEEKGRRRFRTLLAPNIGVSVQMRGIKFSVYSLELNAYVCTSLPAFNRRL